MTNINDDFELIKVIYLGRRLLSDKKLGDKYVTVDLWTKCIKEPENIFVELLERYGSTFKAERKRAIIGGIYEIYCKLEKDSITRIRKSRKFMGTSKNYSNKDIIVQFEIKDKAACTEYKCLKLEKKMKSDTIIEQEMTALRAMYQKTAWQDQVAFEHMVIQSLRRRDS